MNSIAEEVVVERIDQSLSRSRVYALLAIGLGFPDCESHAGFSGGQSITELQQALEICAPHLGGEFREQIAPRLRLTCSFEDFEALFLSSFETNMPAPSAALYEGVHVHKDDRPALILELKGFYRNFGLQMDANGNELEDTLTAELEFMQFLAAKQAQAEMEGISANAYQRAQRDFLERHLAIWIPLVRAEINAKVTTPFFVALADLAEAFVAADLERVRRELAPQF
jgi:putative dimethyl sulfoxide reductase chaperone